MTIRNETAIPTDHPTLAALREADEALEWLKVSIASDHPIDHSPIWRIDARLGFAGEIPPQWDQYPDMIEPAIRGHVAGALVGMATLFLDAAAQLDRLAAEVR